MPKARIAWARKYTYWILEMWETKYIWSDETLVEREMVNKLCGFVDTQMRTFRGTVSRYHT